MEDEKLVKKEKEFKGDEKLPKKEKSKTLPIKLIAVIYLPFVSTQYL